MSGFSASWLSLREPADHQARSTQLPAVLDPVIRGVDPLDAVDLAGGTGSNVRFLVERLPSNQSWVVVDDDPTLLEQLPLQMQSWCSSRGLTSEHDRSGSRIYDDRLTCHVSVQRADVATDIETVIQGHVRLVTASALLDLVSEPWLDRLVRRCEQIRATALLALTYDGRVTCIPEEPEDALVLGLMNQHQRRDKGFGPALGSDATAKAEHRFRASGYHVRREPSDWVLAADSELLQRALIEGWAEAASGMAAGRVSTVRAWRQRRLSHVAHGRSRLTVGHQDLVAWLPVGATRSAPPGEAGLAGSG